jgi:hypothetical protein
MKNYYLILVEKSDNGFTKPIKANIVISEEPESFLLRNDDHDTLMPYFLLHWFKPISKSSYKSSKKNNPTNEGYFDLLKRDYSKFVEEDE